MIDELRPCRETKPTGLAWLPEIPARWEFHRAKRTFREVDERSVRGDEELLSVSHITGVTPGNQKNVTMFMAESYEGHKLCRPADVVVNTMWAWMAAVGVSREVGIVSPSYGVYRPRMPSSFVPRFLDYLLRTEVYRAEYVRASRGITTSRLRLYHKDFLGIPLVQPPIEEQSLIARFLDTHGALTARLIRGKQRLIKLFEEQKQAIIDRAVTRGSGIPSLGEVPQHCEVRRLRNVADVRVSNVDKKSDHGELPVRLCNYIDVYKNDEIDEGIDFMHATASAPEIERFRIRAGDVVITKDSEDWRDIGVPSYVSIDGPDLVCGYHLALLRPIPEVVEGRFLYWQLLGAGARWQFSIAANGVTRYGLSQGAIKGLALVVPPLPTQLRLASHLDDATRDIRVAQRELRREIGLIQELRSRLVVDVVTGKLDVRAAAAALPEITESEPIDEPTAGEDLEGAIDDVENEEVAA
jgi:type I restriction enzyme S subunit